MSNSKQLSQETKQWMRADLSAWVGSLEGQLLTLIDASFSDPQQRKAMKDIVRKMVWDWDRDIMQTHDAFEPTDTVLPNGRIVTQ